MSAPAPGTLIALALGGIAVLVILVTRFKINAFIALIVASLLVGIGAGRPLLAVGKAFQDGLGGTLAGIAAVIVLGSMLGKLLAESHGAEVLSRRFVAWFGPQRVVWCILALAIVVGLATWFVVGLVLLLPILQTLTRETRRPYLMLALPLLAGLSVMHGLMPPHPGAVVAVEALHANTGMVLVWGFVIGLPAAFVAGPLFARWAVRHVPLGLPASAAPAVDGEPGLTLRPGDGNPARLEPPSLALTLFSILLPVVLMLLATIAELVLPVGERVRDIAVFIGNPTIALLISVLFALWSLGARCGFTRSQLLKFTEESVAGVGMAVLIVGGGGGFARVLKEAGVAEALGHIAAAAHISPLLYGWLVAVFIRVATGSATVAITTASGLLAPVLVANPGTNVELLVISIGCGSLFLSHLNDGGFWIVKECLGMTVSQTLRTWTVSETIIGIAGLGFTLAANGLRPLFHL